MYRADFWERMINQCYLFVEPVVSTFRCVFLQFFVFQIDYFTKKKKKNGGDEKKSAHRKFKISRLKKTG